MEELFYQSQEIIEFLPDATFVVNKDKIVVAWNRALEQMTGVPKEEIIGKNTYSHAFYRVSRPCLVDLIWPHERELEQSYPYVGHEGNVLYTETLVPPMKAFLWVKAAPLLDQNKQLLGGIESIRDVTATKLVEKRLMEQMDSQQQLIDAIPSPVFYKDLNGIYRGCNAAFERFLGRAKIEILGKSVYELYPQILADKYQAMDLDLFRNPGFQIEQTSIPAGDGSNHEVIMYNTSCLGKDGQVVGSVGVMIDIAEFKRIEKTLRKTEENLEHILQTASTPILIIDRECKITSVNQEFCKITGYSAEEIIGQTCLSLHWDNCREKCRLLDREAKDIIYKEQSGLSTKNGRHLIVLKNGDVLRDEFGQIAGGVVSFSDITELVEERVKAEKARDRAQHLAQTDYLTDLLNRRAFMERLELEVKLAQEEGNSLSIILIDIDNFKCINDTYGHLAGDSVLQKFAAFINGLCRANDFVGRYGGEEFVVCLPSTPNTQAVKIAERIRAAVQDEPLGLHENGHTIKITASFGVASLQAESTESMDKLLGRADEALYRAKTEGRNRVYTE